MYGYNQNLFYFINIMCKIQFCIKFNAKSGFMGKETSYNTTCPQGCGGKTSGQGVPHHFTGTGRKLRLLLAHASGLVASSACCSPMQPGWSQASLAARPCNLAGRKLCLLLAHASNVQSIARGQNFAGPVQRCRACNTLCEIDLFAGYSPLATRLYAKL